MDAQAWVGLCAIVVSSVGAIWVITVKFSNKMISVEQKQTSFEEVMREKIREATQEYERKITELRKEMEIHETMNDKTFTKIEAKLDQMGSKLDELLGWIKGANKQGI